MVPVRRPLSLALTTQANRLLALFSSLAAIALPAAESTPSPANPPQLDAVNVEAERYKPLAPAFPTYLGFLARPQATGTPMSFSLDLHVLGTVVVTATRTSQAPDAVPASVRLLSAPALRETPAITLDGALRSVPGFSLFRRSDSFTANPTAQGVSLRGLGPSGASRSLVLLDGVPLNDPFGGWVAWTKLPREGLSHAEIVPGGGATAWGNAALGGVIQLFTPIRTGLEVIDRPPQPVGWIVTGALRFAATVGDYGTRSGELALLVPTSKGAVQVLGRDFVTDGFSLVAPERRGPIDIAAWSRHRWATVRWRHALGERLEVLATVRGYEEKRGNGTPYQRNGSREKFASVALAGQPAQNFGWNGVAYVQDQSFASTFSGVNATRTAETPASDQFAVPATAFGAAWTGVWQHGEGVRTSFGGDFRFVRGETREHFTFTNGAFTRLRVAGGKQAIGGVFLLHDRAINPTLRTNVGARVDLWNEFDGHRRESDRATGVASRNDRYADRDGTTFGPSAGLVWTPLPAWQWRANAQHGYRRPTLNELYRPFRVGSNVTEANAALGTERVTSLDLGGRWTLFGERPPRPPHLGRNAAWNPTPVSQLVLGVTAFHNDLRDAVGNVTVARGPGTFPLFGAIAAGGVGRQRLNLDRTRVQGLEFSAQWMPAKTLTVTADYLLNEATVRRASVAPALVGNRVAQVPRKSASVGARWAAPAKFSVAPRVRWIGRQFEDDENQLILGEVVIADLNVTRPLNDHLELFVTIENAGKARIETGRSVDGVVNIGTPRLFLAGLRGHW